MQETPNLLAQLLGQLTDLGGVIEGQQQRTTALGPSHRHTPTITLTLAMAVTLPAASTARPVAAPCPANDNAEG